MLQYHDKSNAEGFCAGWGNLQSSYLFHLLWVVSCILLYRWLSILMLEKTISRILTIKVNIQVNLTCLSIMKNIRIKYIEKLMNTPKA